MPSLTEYHSHPQGSSTPGALRTINFSIDRSKSDVSLGFNVRGGAEFGLGIFVSCVTENSIADTAGFVLGDQILSVNGRSFEGITHQEAVEFITSHSSLSVTVMATGKIPEEEQPIGKYSWIANSGERIVEDCVDCLASEKANSPKPSNDSAKLNVYIDKEAHIPVNQSDSIPETVAHNNQGYSSHSPNYIINTTQANNSADQESMKSKGSQKSKTGSKSGSKKLSKKESKKKGASIKNKDQEKQTMQFERDNLVNEVFETMKDSFSVEEMEIIKQAVTMYHGGESVENLLNRILPLFTPLKFSLLRNIRKVVYADEVLKYDGLVTSYLGRKKRESLIGRRAQSVKSPSAWSEDKYRQASLKSELSSPVIPHHGVPLPGMQGELAGTEIVLQPVKSTYVAKDVSKKSTNQKGRKESPPTTFHFQTPETQPVVAELERKLKPSSQSTTKAPDETDDPAPASLDPLAEAMYSVPHKTKKVVKKVEKTEVLSQPVRKPSFEIKKKISGDSAVLSVRRSSEEGKGSVLVFDDSSFDKSNNSITINATLRNSKHKKGDSIKVKPVVVENSDIPTSDPVVIEQTNTVANEPATVEEVVANDPVTVEDIVANEPVTVEDVTLTVESPDLKLDHPTYEVDELPSSDDNAVEVEKSSLVYEIDKNNQYIGLSISGGSDSRYQREIRVVSVNPSSASHLAGIQVGQVLLSIDDTSLLDLSHAEVCQLIRSTFRDKTNNIMKVCVAEN